MFYEIVNNLCREHNTTITKMSEEIGLSNAAATSWKKGSVPKASTLEKISAYFGVSTDYLLGKEPRNKEAPTQEGERRIDSDIYRIERAKRRMSEQEWERQMKIIEASFGDYFSDNYIDEDVDE